MTTDRKGEAFSHLGSFILVVAMIVGAVFVVKPLFFKERELGDEYACKAAIAEAHLAKRVSRGDPLGFPGIAACERGELLLKKKDLVEQGSSLGIFAGKDIRGEFINQEKSSKMLADAMARCWQMYGEGKLDPFTNWGEEGISYCAVCKVVKFDESLRTFLKNNPDQHIQSPLHYMATHRIKEQGPTYLQYLYGNDGKTLQLTADGLEKLERAQIPEGSYVMVQMYKQKTKSTFQSAAEVIVPLAAGVTAAFLAFPTGGGSLALLAVVSLGTATTVGTSYLADEIGIMGYMGEEAFRDCPECNAYGGMQLIPNEKTLNLQWKATYQLTEKGHSEQIETLKMCGILVN